MKKQWIIMLMMLMVLMLAGCGKEAAVETETSSAEPPAVTAALSEEPDGSSARYENMYFSLDLPSEDLQVIEERSSEYYLVTVSEKSGTPLMEIELYSTDDDVRFPEGIRVIREVSGEEEYTNPYIARNSH